MFTWSEPLVVVFLREEKIGKLSSELSDDFIMK